MQNKVLPGLRMTFWVHFVVGGIFGLGYLLIPDSVAGAFGIAIKDPVQWRLIGAAICAFAASSWWALHETQWERVKIVVEMELVWTVVGTLVLVYGMLAFAYPVLAWISPIILALFAIAFGYFYTQESAVKMATVTSLRSPAVNQMATQKGFLFCVAWFLYDSLGAFERTV